MIDERPLGVEVRKPTVTFPAYDKHRPQEGAGAQRPPLKPPLIYYRPKAFSRRYPSHTLYSNHSFDVSPKNAGTLAAQERAANLLGAIDTIVLWLPPTNYRPLDQCQL